MKKKLSHTAKILMKLIKGETLISSDVFASNTNQYFGHIKDQGIELIEWNEPTEGRHLKRKLNLTDIRIDWYSENNYVYKEDWKDTLVRKK